MDSLLIQLRQLKLAAMASALEQQRLAPIPMPNLASMNDWDCWSSKNIWRGITPLTTLAQTSQSAP